MANVQLLDISTILVNGKNVRCSPLPQQCTWTQSVLFLLILLTALSHTKLVQQDTRWRQAVRNRTTNYSKLRHYYCTGPNKRNICIQLWKLTTDMHKYTTSPPPPNKQAFSVRLIANSGKKIWLKILASNCSWSQLISWSVDLGSHSQNRPVFFPFQVIRCEEFKNDDSTGSHLGFECKIYFTSFIRTG